MHWGPSCSQSRAQEGRGRHRLSTVIQPLRQSAGEVVDLTVDEDGEETFSINLHDVEMYRAQHMTCRQLDTVATN